MKIRDQNNYLKNKQTKKKLFKEKGSDRSLTLPILFVVVVKSYIINTNDETKNEKHLLVSNSVLSQGLGVSLKCTVPREGAWWVCILGH